MTEFTSTEHMVEMDKAIQTELARLAQAEYGCFKCTGGFVFLHDPLSQSLEPAFDSHQRPYKSLAAVDTRYGTLDQVREHPHSVIRACIATVAFQDGRAFSKDPKTDLRIGDLWLSLLRSYGITGSMMAVRLDNVVEERLGVVVVYAQDSLYELSDQDEGALLEMLSEDTSRLRQLLQRWQQAKAEREVERYNDLVVGWLEDLHRGKTADQTCEMFVTAVVRMFGAARVLVSESADDEPDQWIPSVASQQASALRQLADSGSPRESIALNREHQDPHLFARLDDAFGAGHVWCRVSIETSGRPLVCIAGRQAHSVSDHWSPSDLALLSYAVRLLELRLNRASGFDTLLSHLTEVNGEEAKFYHFHFLCHILEDYFGVDQVLLTKVKRKPDRYKVCAEMTKGFDNHDEIMRSRPKELLASESIPAKPDAMIRILVDFLENRAKDIYIATVGEDHPEFLLDDVLVSSCGLKGRMYFVPCCALDSDGAGSSLKSILHLGSRRGALYLPEHCVPLIRTLGKRVAEWLAREDRRQTARTINQIRDIDKCTPDNFQSICKAVAVACSSSGCTLFLSVKCLRLIGKGYGTLEQLEALLVRFVNGYHRWEAELGERKQVIVSMFSAFLGTDIPTTETLFSGPDAVHVARLVAQFLYVRVIQSNAKHELDRFAGLVQKQEERSQAEVVREFGGFVCRNVYLPGYGLTGWVLRYQQPMLLPDKDVATLEQFFAKCRDDLLPPYKRPIINMLRVIVNRPRSILESDEYQPPRHADHISEDPQRNNPQDTYLAFPLEGIQLPQEPMGVLRISNAASLKPHFGTDDQDTVQAAGRHLASLLRREYMQQESYLEETLAERGDEEEFYHCITRFNETIIDLQDQLREGVGSFPQSKRGDLEFLVGRLRELCDSALGGPQLRILALRIRSEPTDAWTTDDLASFVQQWLSTVNLASDVRALSREPLCAIHHRSILWWCLVAEEIVKNLRRYQTVERPIVLIESVRSTRFFISRVSDEKVIMELDDWVPYDRLWQGKAQGGGAKLLRNAAELASIAVEYGYAQSSVLGRKDMVVRVLSHEGAET